MSETEEVSDDRKREWVWRHSAQTILHEKERNAYYEQEEINNG